jgi:NADH-quinone oxidoreductase subunit M
MTAPWLSLALWVPVLGGLGVLALGARRVAAARWLGSAVASAGFLVTLPLYARFEAGSAAMQFVERAPWIPAFGVDYHLGIDGIALPFILLTALTTLLVVAVSWVSVERLVSQYLGAVLILSGLMIGVFAALDGVLFYVLWEAMLIPMFILIGVWGGPNRVYATLKFFLYTFLGSVLLLVALIYLYRLTGSYDLLGFHGVPLGQTAQKLLFLAFLAAFAVKIPMWPVHTWLPDAHVEAPTGGSVILAAIMLKIGGYGFLRLALPIAPDASAYFAPLMIALSLVAIVYVGAVAIVQQDMKKLIAYSSISHMGFVTLGIFLFSAQGIEGGIVQMISHGFISAALFLCVGVLYDRLHSREIASYGGVAHAMPVFAALMMLFVMANSGLPGTSGFVGEFMVVLAAFAKSFWIALGAVTIMVLGAAYNLWLYKRVIFGPVRSPAVQALADLNRPEAFALGVLALLVLSFGVYPAPLTDMTHAAVAALVEHVAAGKLP